MGTKPCCLSLAPWGSPSRGQIRLENIDISLRPNSTVVWQEHPQLSVVNVAQKLSHLGQISSPLWASESSSRIRELF